MLGPAPNLRGAWSKVALAIVVVLAACSPAPEVAAPDTSAPARPGGRVAGEPVDDRARAIVDPSAVTRPTVVHVLGALSVLPESPAAIPQRVALLEEDVASIVTLGCAPGSEGCASDRLGSLDAAAVEVVNLATAIAGTSEVAALRTAVADLNAAGVEVAGWGETRADAVEAVRIEGRGQTVALHAISLAEEGLDRTSHATETSAGIAGPDAFVELLEAMTASREAGDHVVVAVDWGGSDRRSPDDATVDLATALIRAGAGAVVGSGSEFLNRLEVIDGVPVAFDLGQAATATEDALRRDTAVLRVVVDGDVATTCLLPATADTTGPALDPSDEPLCDA